METMEHSLQRALDDVARRGASLDLEGCVDAALGWRRGCPAVAELCDAATGRIVATCLRAGDAAATCAALGTRPDTTQFGYRPCERRQLPRALRTACAEAYRAVAAVCRHLRMAGAAP